MSGTLRGKIWGLSFAATHSVQLLSHPFSFKTTFNHDHEDLLINKKFLTKFGGIRLGILQYTLLFLGNFQCFEIFC